MFDEGYPTLGVPEFVAETPLRRESRSDKARAAEAAFGFEPSLYFYVGWSHPSFGDAVLLYEADSFDRDPGGVLPFDTGGFHLGFIKVRRVTTPAQKRRYVDRHEIPLGKWRNQFAWYVSEHFESGRAYVLGERPRKDDGSQRLHDATDRRAWTWELRLHRDHPLMDHLMRAYLSHDYAEDLRERLRTAEPRMMALWFGRFRAGILKQVEPHESPHTIALAEIAKGCP